MAVLKRASEESVVLLHGESATLAVRLEEASAPMKVEIAARGDELTIEPSSAELNPGEACEFRVTATGGDRRVPIDARIVDAEDGAKLVFTIRVVDAERASVGATSALVRDLRNLGAFADAAFGERVAEDLRAIDQAMNATLAKLRARADTVPDERLRRMLLARLARLSGVTVE